MIGKKDISNVNYYLRKEKSICIRNVEFNRKLVDLELGIFRKKDICSSGKILTAYGPWFHILDDGKSYFRIKSKDEEKEVAFYSSYGVLDIFELKSENKLGNYVTMTIENITLGKKITLIMTSDQKERVFKYFEVINHMNSSKNNAGIKFDTSQFEIFEELIFRLLIKQQKYDEVVRPRQNIKGKRGIDILAYVHKRSYSLKYVFECKNTAVEKYHINKLHETIMQENAVKGIMVGTHGYKSSANQLALKYNIEIMSRKEQLRLLNANNLIFPLMLSEVINELLPDKLLNGNKESGPKTVSELNQREKFRLKVRLSNRLKAQINQWEQWIDKDNVEKHIIEQLFDESTSIYDLCNNLGKNDRWNYRLYDKIEEFQTFIHRKCNKI